MTALHGGSPTGGPVSPWTPGPGDWVVDPLATPTPPPVLHRPRRRLRLLVGAAVLVVVATATGVLTWRVLTSGADTPRAVAEAFLTANERHDWAASWELLCHSERERLGSLAMWSDVQELDAEIRGPSLADETVTVHRVRLDERSSPPSFLVDLEHDTGVAVYFDTLLVVEEADGLKACGLH